MDTFRLEVPLQDGQTEAYQISASEMLFILGANGTGKSTLMHHFTKSNLSKCRRITAHRQVWLNKDGIDLTPATRKQTEQNILSNDRQENSRYKDDYATQRSQLVFFDLIDAENVEARKIADAARAGDISLVEQLAKQQSPVAKMNDILAIANLGFTVDVDEGSKLIAKKGDLPPYSIAELSDGERNALLIISNILTAPEGSLLLIDEPERHLHRSIVSPLLSTLLHYREDCAFVISTHDPTLPLDQARCSALLIRNYSHEPRFWAVDYLDAVENMDESLAEALLGSRRKILFVEGVSSSLDLQLYQILFPDVSIKASGSCTEIERIVAGLRSTATNHWLSVFGIIDRDNRSDEECKELSDDGLIALRQYSIESLYYHPCVVKTILKRISTINTVDIDSTMSNITSSVVESVRSHKERLAARLVERRVRDEAMRKVPNWKEILQGGYQVTFESDTAFKEEKDRMDELLKANNIEEIICRYPVRETPALEQIIKELGFQSQEKYEDAVRKLMHEDEAAKQEIFKLLEPLPSLLSQNQGEPEVLSPSLS